MNPNSTKINNEIARELYKMVHKIRARIPVSKIILFGSHANGTASPNNDIDLCIITEDTRRKIEIMWDVQDAIYKTATKSVDIIVSRPEEFLDRVDSVATIEKTVANKGVVIYELKKMKQFRIPSGARDTLNK